MKAVLKYCFVLHSILSPHNMGFLAMSFSHCFNFVFLAGGFFVVMVLGMTINHSIRAYGYEGVE